MMRAVVVDASAVAGYLFDAERYPGVAAIIGDEESEVLVPYLCDVEVASALRSAIARKSLDVSRAEEALDAYRGFSLERFAHLPFLGRILELRDNFTAADAVYVALAEAFSVPFHTADHRLARAVREHTKVEVVAA
jgi:predicted nucleic acid-binding protein